MKKFLCLFVMALPLTAAAQGILDRFTDPEKGPVVFVGKGSYAMGVSGAYRNFQVGGDDLEANDGFQILSYLNIGSGQLQAYNAAAGFSYFVADDLSLGLNLGYTGYNLDSDLSLGTFKLFNRHIHQNAWSGNLALRKYLSFFGSRTFAIFAEGRLYGKYSRTQSCPIVPVMEEVPIEIDGKIVYKEDGTPFMTEVESGETRWDTDKNRLSDSYSVGLRLCGGLAVRLRDNSALTVSVPIMGAAYTYSHQKHEQTGNASHLSSFNVSRGNDLLGIQIGYTHFIGPKKKK